MQSFPPTIPPFIGDVPLSGSRYQFGLATVVMLVLLRLNIGWHFYSEGVNHYTDPTWSSAGVLRAAKGPLASTFRAYLPDFHGQKSLMVDGNADAVDAWLKRISDHFAVEEKKFADYYQFDESQRADSGKILKLRQDQVLSWGPAHKEELANYIHDRERLAKAKSEPTAKDVPFQKKRIADKEAELNALGRSWLSDLEGVERQFHAELADLRTDEQTKRGLPPHEKTSLQKVDSMMTYGIMGIGICLILGLFTRLACVLGAAFLCSVVLTQPFWVSEAAPTFNQWVEMFALLTLATTNVGKWGGLDFFISYLFGGCCRGKCETT